MLAYPAATFDWLTSGAAGTGGASRQGAQSCLVNYLTGKPRCAESGFNARAIVFNRVFYALPSAICWKMGPLQRGDCPFLLYPEASTIAPQFLRQQRVKGQPMQPQLPPDRQHRWEIFSSFTLPGFLYL